VGIRSAPAVQAVSEGAAGGVSDRHHPAQGSNQLLTGYSFSQTWITIALERGVTIAKMCDDCDT